MTALEVLAVRLCQNHPLEALGGAVSAFLGSGFLAGVLSLVAPLPSSSCIGVLTKPLKGVKGV